MSWRAELLRRAANCYLSAARVDDACRCFEQLQEHARAARLHEHQERWLAAARGYEQAGLWQDAARCYERCDWPNEAAACLLQSGERLPAAWLLVDRAQRWRRAHLLAQEITPDSLADRLALELLLARCETAGGHARAAAVRLQRVIEQFDQLSPGPARQRVEAWAFSVTDHLQRPDLCAALHAATVAAGSPGAARRWESWALATWGDATGVPLEPIEEDTQSAAAIL